MQTPTVILVLQLGRVQTLTAAARVMVHTVHILTPTVVKLMDIHMVLLWANRTDGSSNNTCKSNPAYCYESGTSYGQHGTKFTLMVVHMLTAVVVQLMVMALIAAIREPVLMVHMLTAAKLMVMVMNLVLPHNKITVQALTTVVVRVLVHLVHMISTVPSASGRFYQVAFCFHCLIPVAWFSIVYFAI